MRPVFRLVASSLLLAVVSACSSNSVADLTGPSFAKGGGGGGGAVTPPATTPNLGGHWTQSNRIHITTALGTTDYWYEFDVTQKGTTLTGTAAQHANTFNFDGSPWLVDFVGSPGKLSGTVAADGSATIVFNRIGETNITLSYSTKLSADGTTLVVKAPAVNGPHSFTR